MGLMMRIHFERTGGFAGIRLQTTVDTDQLPPKEARQLSSLVDAAKLFDLPDHAPAASQGADQFQYQLVVDAPGKQKTIATSDAAANQNLQALWDWLTDQARKPAKS